MQVLLEGDKFSAGEALRLGWLQKVYAPDQLLKETLRYALFGRQGITERLIIKLQELTGVELISREAIENNIKMWLDYLYGEQPEKAKRVRKARTSK